MTSNEEHRSIFERIFFYLYNCLADNKMTPFVILLWVGIIGIICKIAIVIGFIILVVAAIKYLFGL